MTLTPAMVKKIAAVQAAAPSLKKGERNEGAGFNFVGIDTFYEQVASVALEKGLTWVAVEDGIELVPMPTGELVVCQKFHANLLDTEDGTVAEDFFRLTVPAPFSDAQTAGISVSYFDKALMRSVFKVVTGEKDADHMAKKKGQKAPPAEPLPELEDESDTQDAKDAQKKKPGRPPKAKEEKAEVAKLDEPKADEPNWEAISEFLLERLDECESAGDLEAFRNDQAGEINKLKKGAAESEDADTELQKVQNKFKTLLNKYDPEDED